MAPPPRPTLRPTERLTARQFFDRALNKQNQGDNEETIPQVSASRRADYTQAIRLKPDYILAYRKGNSAHLRVVTMKMHRETKVQGRKGNRSYLTLTGTKNGNRICQGVSRP